MKWRRAVATLAFCLGALRPGGANANEATFSHARAAAGDTKATGQVAVGMGADGAIAESFSFLLAAAADFAVEPNVQLGVWGGAGAGGVGCVDGPTGGVCYSMHFLGLGPRVRLSAGGPAARAQAALEFAAGLKGIGSFDERPGGWVAVTRLGVHGSGALLGSVRLANWVLLYGRGAALVNAVPSAGWRTRLGVSAGTGLEFNLWGFRPYFEGSLLAQSARAPSVIEFSDGRLSLLPQVLAGVALVFD